TGCHPAVSAAGHDRYGPSGDYGPLPAPGPGAVAAIPARAAGRAPGLTGAPVSADSRWLLPRRPAARARHRRCRTPAAAHGVIAAWRRQFPATAARSEEHTSELQSRENLVCRLLLEKKKDKQKQKKYPART